MRNHVYRRIQSLKQEYDTGLKLQAEYKEKQGNLRKTLLRISGAIQVLEEVLAEADSEANGEVSVPDDRPTEMEPIGELASGEG